MNLHTGLEEMAMRLPHGLALLLVLAIPVSANAQRRGGHAAQPPATAPQHGGGHPGHLQQSHMMTMEQHMWHQMYLEQMMLNEIMSMPSGRYHHPQRQGTRQSHGGMDQSQAGMGQIQGEMGLSQPDMKGHRRGVREHSKSGQQVPKNSSGAETSASNEALPNGGSGNKGKRGPSALEEQHLNRRELAHRVHAREAIVTPVLPLTIDRPVISHLLTAHGMLRQADHDYDGHRVQAMHHIVAALDHLGFRSSSPMTYGDGLGNMAQAESDSLLRNSVVKLNIAEQSLGTGTRSAVHHHNARASVAEAIQEVHIALNVR
jgi:hypothetical protein